jgi:hypothetical protein
MEVLEKDLPEDWKLAIATKIENNLFAKVAPSLYHELAKVVQTRISFTADIS